MIIAECTTNLDDFKKENWPDRFQAVPRIGDWVESGSGKKLKVVSITHKTKKTPYVAGYTKGYMVGTKRNEIISNHYEYIIIVELNR